MADNKKISELNQIQSLNDADEFVVVDKSTTNGTDAGSGGKTTRATLGQLKEAVSAAGAKGDKGDQGVQGAQGAQGPQGPQGAQGPKGNTGANGPQGPQGVQGQSGINGTNGAKGQKGHPGSNGAKGATGARGLQGPQGPRGYNGSNGAKGATGARGPQGPQGPRGIQGIQGPRGSNGSNGAKGAIGPRGPQGPQGPRGPQGPKGDSGVFSGGTITSPTTINSSADQKLILQGSGSPYIRFREGTTDKAYIQWNANGSFYFVNQESGEHLRIASGINGLIYHADGTNRTVWHSGNLSAVTTANNTGLNSDSRNTRGVTRLYRRDNNSDYSVQTSWTGSHWHLRGYSGDNFHGECRVGHADNASKLDGKSIGSFVRTDSNTNVSADTEWQDNKSIYLGAGADYRMYHNSNHHTYFQNRNHGKGTYFQSEDSGGTNRAHLYLEGGSRPYVRLFEHGSERLRTTSSGVKIANVLDTYASNGNSGYIQADGHGFMRVVGRQAGVGLCMAGHDGEVFRVHRESWAGTSVCNAGEAFISSFNRSHTNGNDATVVRIGRRGEIQSTGLMKGVHTVNNHQVYFSNNSRFMNGTWKNVDKGHAFTMAFRDNGFAMHISDSVNAGANTRWRASLEQKENHDLVIHGRHDHNSANIYVVQPQAFASGKNSRVSCVVGRASGDVREPHATFQMQPAHYGGCMTIVSGKNVTAWHCSVSVQNRTHESNAQRFVPLAFGENMVLGYTGLRWKQVYARYSTIITSDKRVKDNIRDLETAEKNVGKKLKSNMKIYQLKSALEQKGDKARLHCGVIAQDVIEIFKSENLDPFRYSVLCHEIWYEKKDKNGEKLTSEEPKEGYERKEVYSVRYEELFGFIISAL